MKEKEIIEIVDDRFSTIDKLYHKIIDEFEADDIHDFRVTVKKPKAFLRLIDAKKDNEEPVIPKLLKTFYRYVGIVRNMQLHERNVFKYITGQNIKKPVEYSIF